MIDLTSYLVRSKEISRTTGTASRRARSRARPTELIANMKKDKFTAGLLYVGIFAGIPLAIIVALFFLKVLNGIDQTAIVILVIFTVVLVALWIFVPSKETVIRKPRSAKERKAAARLAVPAPSEAPEAPIDEEKQSIESSKERREPFVEAVEKSTHHPAAQPQIRRKAQSKARKKSSKKKKR